MRVIGSWNKISKFFLIYSIATVVHFKISSHPFHKQLWSGCKERVAITAPCLTLIFHQQIACRANTWMPQGNFEHSSSLRRMYLWLIPFFSFNCWMSQPHNVLPSFVKNKSKEFNATCTLWSDQNKAFSVLIYSKLQLAIGLSQYNCPQLSASSSNLQCMLHQRCQAHYKTRDKIIDQTHCNQWSYKT